MKANTRAFADFLLGNPSAINQVDNLQFALELLDCLARKKGKKREILPLVGLTQHHRFGDQLLGHLSKILTREEDKQEFYRLVLDYSGGCVGSVWTCSGVDNALSGADLYDLLKLHPDLPAKLASGLNFDRYWSRKVLWQLKKGDHRRAWDELNKARRGLLGASTCPCSQDTLAKLVDDLYSAMTVKDLVPIICSADLVLYGNREVKKVSQSKQQAGRRVASHTQLGAIASFEFACLFRIKTISPGNPYPYVFHKTGAKVLKLAAYFRGEKNDRRRKRLEKAFESSMPSQMNSSS